MKNLVFFLILILNFSLNAQMHISPELNRRLEGVEAFNDYWKIVNDYYKDLDISKNKVAQREYKKWHRWAWWAARHMDSDGKFQTDNSTMLASILKEEANRATSNAMQTNGGNWYSMGPINLSAGIARVDRVAFHPTDANQLYCGTPSGGLWKSNNGGNSWFALNGYQPQLGISGIVVDQTNPNIIYALTGEFINQSYSRVCYGVLKSIDAGQTWSLKNKIANSTALFNSTFGYRLVQVSGSRLIASTNEGTYITDDAGETWTRTNLLQLEELFKKPASNTTLYGANNSAIYKSTDSGNNFTTIPLTTLSADLAGFTNGNIKLAVSLANPNQLTVQIGGTINGNFVDRIYNSLDSGTSFTLKTNSAPGVRTEFYAAMGISSQNSNYLFSGNVSLVKSENGGTTFGLPPMDFPLIHSDHHEILPNPLDNKMYFCTDGGIYTAPDQTVNITMKSNGIAATQFYRISGTSLNDNIFVGGAQDNGVILRKSNGDVDRVGGGDGFASKFLNNSQDEFIGNNNFSIFKYTISTSTSTNITPPGMSEFNPAIEIHPTNNSIIYLGYSTQLLRSNNGGSTWSVVNNFGSSPGLIQPPAGGLAVSAQQPNRIYMANFVTACRSDNMGNTITLISSNPGWPVNPGNITDICTRSTNADEVWVTFTSGRVIYSQNAGATWVNFTGSLPPLPIYCIAYTSNGDAYIGTEAGVYYMGFNMSDWVPFYNGLPMLPVTDIFINETASTIKVSTYGRGVWKSDLRTNCQSNVYLAGNFNGQYRFQSSNTIESVQVVNGNYGNNISYRAGTKIRLMPGFTIKEGAYFHTNIGPCDQGVYNLHKKIPEKY